MTQKIKFVYFDVGGVIFRYRHMYDALAEKFNISADMVRRVIKENIDDMNLGKSDSSSVWKKLCHEANIDYDPNFDFRSERALIFEPIIETHELLYKLEKTKIAFGILSNAEKGLIELCIKYNRIPNVSYTRIIESAQVGLKKPDTKLFSYAQSITNVPGENILLIDDAEKNIVAAHNCGWQTYLFNEKNPINSAKEIEKMLDIK